MSEVIIWKFEAPIADTFTLNLPVGASVLSVNEQDGKICIWAMVDPDAETAPRNFSLVSTGHPPPDIPCGGSRIFYGAVLLNGGSLVFHLFEVEGVTPIVLGNTH